MKKLFVVLCFASVMISCKNKKEEEKKSEETTATVVLQDVPSFSDPELQKAANEYSVIMTESFKLMKDTAKWKNMDKKAQQELSTRVREIHAKMMKTPEDSAKWTKWVISILDQKNQ